MSFPRYPSYKDSGVEWLGQVPENWQLGPIKRLIQKVESGTSVNASDEPAEGGRLGVLKTSCVYTGTFDPDENKTVVEEDIGRVSCPLKAGTLIVSRMNTPELIGAAGIVTQTRDNLYLPDRLWQVSFSNADPRFVYYWTLTSLYRGQVKAVCTGTSSSMKNLGQDQFGAFSFAAPSLAEQSAIVEFLDRETGKIDELVAEQRRLMELLKEKRQAVISHAVTRGLNPATPLKPSGIEWLGDVPAHWSVATVRRIIDRIEQGWSPDCFARPAESEEWGVVKSGCVNRGVFVEEENKALPENLEPVPEYEIHDGDVLMSRASGSPELVGSTAYILQTRPKLMLSDKIFRIHLEPQVDKKFFVAVFNSRVMRSQIERAISGADGLANNLPQSAMKSFFCAIPPLAEQTAIVVHLEGELAKFDTLTAEAQRAIDLLQERRTALISAAVTGQIDVRGGV